MPNAVRSLLSLLAVAIAAATLPCPAARAQDAPAVPVATRDVPALDSALLAPPPLVVDSAVGGRPLRAATGTATARTSTAAGRRVSKAVRLAAARSRDLRVVVSIADRRLWALVGDDTLMSAPVAVGTEGTLAFEGRSWQFSTPRGVHRVVAKDTAPVWTPPDWHYVEVANRNGLQLRALRPGRAVPLEDGTRLVARGSEVGVLYPDSVFAALPTDEEIVFGDTLFVPPIGTVNRRIAGELGRFRLDLGGGYLLHGTPDEATIGAAVTHGCVRLRDEDVEWLYDHVPVGTRVYIY